MQDRERGDSLYAYRAYQSIYSISFQNVVQHQPETFYWLRLTNIRDTKELCFESKAHFTINSFDRLREC